MRRLSHRSSPTPPPLMLNSPPNTPWLPSNNVPYPSSNRFRRHPRRCLAIFAVVALLFLFFLRSSRTEDAPEPVWLPPPPLSGQPSNLPTYYEWYEKEKAMPQHEITLSYPQGREGRYLWIANHVVGTYIPVAFCLFPTRPHSCGQPLGGAMPCRKP